MKCVETTVIIKYECVKAIACWTASVTEEWRCSEGTQALRKDSINGQAILPVKFLALLSPSSDGAMTCCILTSTPEAIGASVLSDLWAGFKQVFLDASVLEQWELQLKSRELQLLSGEEGLKCQKFYCWELLGLRYDLLKSAGCALSSEDPFCPFPIQDCSFHKGRVVSIFLTPVPPVLRMVSGTWEGLNKICWLNDSSSQTSSDGLLCIWFWPTCHLPFLYVKDKGKKSMKTQIHVVMPSWANTQDFCQCIGGREKTLLPSQPLTGGWCSLYGGVWEVQ